MPGTAHHTGWPEGQGEEEKGRVGQGEKGVTHLPLTPAPVPFSKPDTPILHSCSAAQPQTELPGITFSDNSLPCELSWKSGANNKYEARPSSAKQSCSARLTATSEESRTLCRDFHVKTPTGGQKLLLCPGQAQSLWLLQSKLSIAAL